MSIGNLENLNDQQPAAQRPDREARALGGGQLARVGRRSPVSSDATTDAPEPNVQHDTGPLPARSRERARVQRPPARGEDLHGRAGAVGKRFIGRVARWLVSSPGEVAERATDDALREPVGNSQMNVVTLAGQRGGVGKTALTVTVGSLLADACRLNVVAVDADLDYGPLADHVPAGSRSNKTVVDLLCDFDGDQPVALPRLRPYLSRMPSGLRVLGAPRARREMRNLTAADLDRALTLLSNFDVCLLDCAAGVERDLAPWATSRADRLIIVTTAEHVGARNVRQAIAALPLENAVLAINMLSGRGAGGAAGERELFAGLLDRRFLVRYDERLHRMLDGARLDIARLDRATRLDLKRLAVAIARGLR